MINNDYDLDFTRGICINDDRVRNVEINWNKPI